MKRLALMVGTLLAAGLFAPALSAAQSGAAGWPNGHSGPVSLRRASTTERALGTPRLPSAAASLFRRQGYLVPDQAAYDRAKAEAAVRAGQAHTAAPQSPKSRVKPLIASGDPDINPAWTGLQDPLVSPPDTTGAIGPSRYVQLINDKFGIYDRNGNVLSTGELQDFAGANTDCVTDPQIIWDPQTNRFFYVVLEFSHFAGPCTGGTNSANRLYIGFSRTAAPGNASFSSWCKYYLPFFPSDADMLPDYPKLGDNSAFMLIGSNNFENNPPFDYLGSDVTWITKPGSGTACPALGADHLPGPLQASDGQAAFTPVPANQTDTGGTGYVAATSTVGNTFIDTYPVSTNFANPVGAAVAHPVAAFSAPPNAPQSGTSAVLDTLEGRLTTAVSALDPSTGTLGIWTQHAVAGGAGSQVRWYEINPSAAPPTRFGAATSGSLYAFNGAISPDRKVSGSTKLFGDAFALGFNTSSASDFVRIQMVSKWANNPQSEFVEVKASPGFNDDFTCNVCRWGDYSGASPDPAANQYSNHGRVWLANQWNVASTDSSGVDWRTYVWGTNPAPYVVLNGPSTLFQKGTSFKVGWTLGNQASAADIRYRRAPWNGSFGGFTTWKSKVPAGSATFGGSPGNTYCFSAQSYDDTAGGPRAWGFGPERCAVVPLDDRALAASSGWSRLNGSGFFKNTYTRSSTLGKSLTRTGIHARRIYVMVEKCPTCGSIKIYWAGSLKHTYSLAGALRKKVYLFGASFGSVQTGTLKIVVSSTGKPVIIDALGVSAV